MNTVHFGRKWGTVESRFVQMEINGATLTIEKEVESGKERFFVTDARNMKPIELSTLDLAIEWCMPQLG